MKASFSLLNSYFDRVYVITLKRAADRHAHIARELDGLNYELFYGKDKLEFDLKDLKEANIYNEELAIRHHRFSKPMPPGMIGCSWSHLLVYRDMLQKGYGKVLILEDDVVMDERGAQILPDALAELPKDWELLYFGFANNEQEPPLSFMKKTVYHFLHLLGTLKFTHRTIRNLYPRRISRHLYRAGYHDCTHAYALTASGARKLEALQQPISFLPDNLLAFACTNELINAYIILPKVINQQYQVSDAPTHSYINH